MPQFIFIKKKRIMRNSKCFSFGICFFKFVFQSNGDIPLFAHNSKTNSHNKFIIQIISILIIKMVIDHLAKCML